MPVADTAEAVAVAVVVGKTVKVPFADTAVELAA